MQNQLDLRLLEDYKYEVKQGPALSVWSRKRLRSYLSCVSKVSTVTGIRRAAVAILIIVIVVELSYLFGVSEVSTVTGIKRFEKTTKKPGKSQTKTSQHNHKSTVYALAETAIRIRRATFRRFRRARAAPSRVRVEKWSLQNGLDKECSR